MKTIKYFILLCFILGSAISIAQNDDAKKVYKKRVLESTEVAFLTSYFAQDGDNAAVSGGIGTEELTDITAGIIISIPINADDVLTIDAGISSYTSASSSNIDPFDGDFADPFQASSGASSGDAWKNISASYSHSSDNRNNIVSANVSVASEYDYFSVGVGGSFTKLFNEKNTELSIKANLFIDSWSEMTPRELRPFVDGGNGLNDGLFFNNSITGNPNYMPQYKGIDDYGRNTYSAGLGFSQILHKNVQASLAFDIVQQQGLLSTPFQRVYFSDVDDSYIENFHLADDVEQLPDNRLKIAFGGRLNWYLNEYVTVRTFYRYYFDDWAITSHTASIEIPVKITNKFTLYPSYRFYNQTAAKYFNVYEEALSSDEFYTSDYDLSEYSSNQFGFGLSYTDIFTKAKIWKIGLKSIDLKFYKYDRNTSFSSYMITGGLSFVIE